MSKLPSEIACEIAQECISHAPVIILGSGASSAFGIPGMPGLSSYFQRLELPEQTTEADERSWNEFTGGLEVADLESVLNSVRLSGKMTDFVVKSTWDYLIGFDIDVFDKMLEDVEIFPLTKIYRHLFRSTNKDINVITPNYDRLAEYAADAARIHHYTGFASGHLRSRVTGAVPRVLIGKEKARTVNIWKVHGSLDWFRSDDGIVVGLPVSRTRPKNLVPVIVTPGIEKYRLTHDEPFLSIKVEADKALRAAESFLCVGYGFNDSHLQTTLVERCRDKPVPLVLLTKSITDTAHAFLRGGKCGRYLAIEKCGDGCRIFSSEFPDGSELPGRPLWMLDQFLTLIM